MSVLIKGMKMPQSCYMCDMLELSGAVGCKHAYDTSNSEWGRALNCPLIELPDHGDLIDRNMLIGGFADWYIQESPMYLGDNKVVAETIGDAMKAIEAATVVIPAERSEE